MTPKFALLACTALMSLQAASPILVHGHRGTRTLRPENTIASFEAAIAAGADYIELDLHATKDNVLVVAHDAHINETICQGPGGERLIRKLTLAEVRQWDCGTKQNPGFPRQQPVPGAKIPTFDEVLGLAPKGTFHYNIEIKMNPAKPEESPSPAEFARMTVDAIRRHKLEKRVQVQSFDFRPVKEVKAIAPELLLAALYAGPRKSLVEISKEAGGTPVVAPVYTMLDQALVDEAHQAGLKVVPWTANTEEAWLKLIGLGVDAIITDDPAALVPLLRARGLHK